MSIGGIQTSGLNRNLGLSLLVFYGLGIIIGAGIYVVTGNVIEIAGGRYGAMLSFVIAGFLALLTALSYAELSARYPEAAGAAAYVKEAFRSPRLSQLTGLAVMNVTLVSAATIAHGAAAYAQSFIHLPPAPLAACIVFLFTGIACLGVKDSVRLAGIMTVIELAGLFLVLSFGITSSEVSRAVVNEGYEWKGVLGGAFLALFAFTGFENLANMAEEAKNARKAVPLAILISLAVSTVLYLAVVFVVGGSFSSETAHLPALLSVFGNNENAFPGVLSIIALIAISNGVLIQILTLSRLFYGMAHRDLLPEWLSRTDSRHVPVPATLFSGFLVLISAIVLPFESLLRLSTMLTLGIFAVVSLSLWRLKLTTPVQETSFNIPVFIPVISVFCNLSLMLIQLVWAS